jgi:hypothetical protein
MRLGGQPSDTIKARQFFHPFPQIHLSIPMRQSDSKGLSEVFIKFFFIRREAITALAF